MKKIFNKKRTLFYILLFSLGLIFGLIFIFLISDLDKFVIKEGLNEYITNITSNKYSYKEGLILSLKSNILYLTIIWLCGIVFIFIPIVIFIIFYKGFITGFMISSFILTYKAKGLLYSILFIFPYEIINILTIIIFSIYSVIFARKIIKVIYNNEEINLRKISKNYFIIYLISIFISLISSLIEIYFNSFLIRIFI